MTTQTEVLKLALEALEEIALAGMYPSPEMIDSKEAFHARQAWRFIGIAARALEPIKEALAQPEQEPVAQSRPFTKKQRDTLCTVYAIASASTTANSLPNIAKIVNQLLMEDLEVPPEDPEQEKNLLKRVISWMEKVSDSTPENTDDEGIALVKDIYKALAHPPVPTAQPRDCTRSHPHEEMSKECELRTEIARLQNQLAQPCRHELQAKGEHPAPCARFCEANAFRIAERGFHRRIEELEAKLNAKPEQEPDDLTIAYMAGFSRGKDSAPQRTWVGLTDEEIELLNSCGDTDSYKFAKSIEAKLKEKNG